MANCYCAPDDCTREAEDGSLWCALCRESGCGRLLTDRKGQTAPGQPVERFFTGLLVDRDPAVLRDEKAVGALQRIADLQKVFVDSGWNRDLPEYEDLVANVASFKERFPEWAVRSTP